MTAPLPPVSTALLAGVAVLGVGTYLLRLSGTLLQSRVPLTARWERVVTRVVVVLLAALAVTATMLDGPEWAGPSRVAGVAAGGMLAWFRAPLVIVVPAAAVVAAGLRLLGVP